MKVWRKSLQAMTDAFSTAGFRLTAISEPQPDQAAGERFPDGFIDLSTKPTFLFFVLAVPSAIDPDG
jgi:hypothetical protein